MVRVMLSTGAKKGTGLSRTYKCKTCGKTFDSKKELQAHNKKTHGGKNQQRRLRSDRVSSSIAFARIQRNDAKGRI